MKFVIFTILAIVASTSSAPSEISNNNVGDITNIALRGQIDYNNQIDVSLIKIMLSVMNQQLGVIVAPANEIEPMENQDTPGELPDSINMLPQQEVQQPPTPQLTPENMEKIKSFLKNYKH